MAPGKATNKGQPQQRLKIVVRRLPPDLPAAVFWKSVAPWVTREDSDAPGLDGSERVLWSEYRPGKVRKRCDSPSSSLAVEVLTH